MQSRKRRRRKRNVATTISSGSKTSHGSVISPSMMVEVDSVESREVGGCAAGNHRLADFAESGHRDGPLW